MLPIQRPPKIVDCVFLDCIAKTGIARDEDARLKLEQMKIKKSANEKREKIENEERKEKHTLHTRVTHDVTTQTKGILTD